MSVEALALANVFVWIAVFGWSVNRRRRYHRVPDGVFIAACVGVLAASIGGSVAALGFTGLITPGAAETAAALWRGAMLCAGIYAAIAAVRAARSKR